jgi:hypothetical protein
MTWPLEPPDKRRVSDETSGPARRPWEQRPNEGVQPFAAFVVFLQMGPRRSYRTLAMKLGRQNSQISEWGRKFAWCERALAWDDEIWKTRNEERRNAIRAEANRQAQECTVRRQANRQQDDRTRELFFANITKMLGYPQQPQTRPTRSPEGKITGNTKVNNPRWSYETAAQYLKLASDVRQRWSRARGAADNEQREENWNIVDYDEVAPAPLPIEGDPERSIAPPGAPADEESLRKTAAPLVNEWDRLPAESSLSSAAFRAFLELGPGRSCRQVAKNLNRQRSQILGWCREHDWVNRARAWDAHWAEADYVERRNARKAASERWVQEQTARELAQRQQEEKILDLFTAKAISMLESLPATLKTKTVKGPDGTITLDTVVTPTFSMKTPANLFKLALELGERNNRNARAMADEEQEDEEYSGMEDHAPQL